MTHLQAVIDRLEADRFVGRTGEISLFRELLKSGRPALLNVHGVGGIGKTSLLRAFAREAAAAGVAWIAIDGAGLQPTPREFCRQLLAELAAHGLGGEAEQSESRLNGSIADCHAAFSRMAACKRLVLGIDTYEEIQPLDRWLRQTFVSRLPSNTIIVIAGRNPLSGEWLYSPAWRELLHSMPLTEFTLAQAQEYLSRCGVSDERAIHSLWLSTQGHPLALSLAVPLAGSDLVLQQPSLQTEAVLRELTQRWLKEFADAPLRLLVEAAAVVPEWDHDRLSAILDTAVSMSDFEQLVLLSFVRRTRRGWTLHALVRDAVAANLAAMSPARYREYQQHALRFIYERLLAASATNTEERTRLASEAFYLMGSPLMRRILAEDPAESGFFMEPATADEISAWSGPDSPWRSTTYLARMLLPLADPTAQPAEPPAHEQGRDIRQAHPSYLHELLTLDPECIHVLRDASGTEQGIFVTIPISEETLPFLQTQPVTAPYFGTLSEAELAEYATAASSPAGWFIRALGLSDPENSTALAALMYGAMLLLFNAGHIIASTPLPFYQSLLQGIGFAEVPGASHYDFGPDIASPTFRLDLRGTHLAEHIERLAIQAGFDPLRPPNPLRKFGLTPREYEVAELVAEGLANREIAERLHLSEITVKKHLSQVLAKAGLKSRSQLVRLVHQPGAADPGLDAGLDKA